MEIAEVIFAYGHKNIQATHKTTLEITKDNNLSEKGDCIIAVAASRSLAELDTEFKEALRQERSKLRIRIEAAGIAEALHALGSPALKLSHPTDIVVRRSNFICNRTLAIHADKAACSLPREFVNKLKDSSQKLKITLTVNV